MSILSDLNQINKKIDEKRAEQLRIDEAIRLMQEPRQEAAEAVAAASVAVSALGRIKAAFALGRASAEDVGAAEAKRLEASRFAAKFATAEDDGTAQAIAVLTAESRAIGDEVRDLEQRLPALQNAVLKEHAWKKIHEFHTQIIAMRASLNEARAACIAADVLSDPSKGIPALVSHFANFACNVQHFNCAHGVIDGVMLGGAFPIEHVPSAKLELRAAEIQRDVLGLKG